MNIFPIYESMTQQIQSNEKLIGCWQRFKDGIHWVQSRIVWFVGILANSIAWRIQIVSALAFKGLGAVWPVGADKLEALWVHVMLIVERVAAAVREENLLQKIFRLEVTNQILVERVQNQFRTIINSENSNQHLIWQGKVLTEERNTARTQRDQQVYGKASLTRELTQLEQDIEDLKAKLNKAINERDEAIRAKNAQQIDYQQALQKVAMITMQLDQVGRNDELLHWFRKIDEAYEGRRLNQGENQPNLTELELQELIPVYEKHKKQYMNMIEKTLNDLPAEHELRVPLEGILRIIREEAGHLQRISKEIHYYAELKDQLNELRQAIPNVIDNLTARRD